LGNPDVLYRHVMTYAMGYFTLYKLHKDTFPLNDSPILIKPKSIMVALSPRLLLEIDRTKNNIPHDCCVSNYIPQDKFEEFQQRTIANTFREIIFGNPTLLEEWRNTKAFAERHALISNIKSYNAVVAQYAGSEIWKINAYSDREPAGPTSTLIGPCSVLLYPGVAQEATTGNVVRIDFIVEDGLLGTLVPLFTDSQFAEKFLIARGESAKGITIFELGNLDVLGSLLVDLHKAGTTHVHFNAMPPGSASPEPVPIGEVIDSLSQAKVNAGCQAYGT
jgi:hypothetical protein